MFHSRVFGIGSGSGKIGEVKGPAVRACGLRIMPRARVGKPEVIRTTISSCRDCSLDGTNLDTERDIERERERKREEGGDYVSAEQIRRAKINDEFTLACSRRSTSRRYKGKRGEHKIHPLPSRDADWFLSGDACLSFTWFHVAPIFLYGYEDFNLPILLFSELA